MSVISTINPDSRLNRNTLVSSPEYPTVIRRQKNPHELHHNEKYEPKVEFPSTSSYNPHGSYTYDIEQQRIDTTNKEDSNFHEVAPIQDIT